MWDFVQNLLCLLCTTDLSWWLNFTPLGEITDFELIWNYLVKKALSFLLRHTFICFSKHFCIIIITEISAMHHRIHLFNVHSFWSGLISKCFHQTNKKPCTDYLSHFSFPFLTSPVNHSSIFYVCKYTNSKGSREKGSKSIKKSVFHFLWTL